MSHKIKKWAFLLLLIFIAVLVLAVNQFTNTIYDLNLYEYFKYSQDLSEDEINYLKEKNTLYYTSDNNAPPFSFKDKYSGLYKGFILDYVTALSIELNTEIEFVPRVWEDAIQSVISGDADMIELYPSEDRKRYMEFTESIYELRAIIMTRNNQQEIIHVMDLKGLKVAIEAGDYANEYIKNIIPDIEIINTTDYLEAVNKLLSNEVDAIIGDEPILIYFTNNLSIEEQVNILEEPLYEMDICIGVNKAEAKLVNIVNKAILDLKRNDFAPKIQQKWFGLSAPIHKDKINAQIMFLLIIILSLFAMIVAGISVWTYFLKKQVVKQTDELNDSKNDLQLTLDAISDFLIVINENGLIENVNKSFSDWLSKDKDDIIDCSFKDIPLLNSLDINTDEIGNEAVYKGRLYNYYITSLESGNKRILVSIEDKTNEIISSRQMLQHNKMIAVGQLAAGLSHEIRNPLGIIRNYCYVLKNKLLNNDPLIDKSLNSIESSVLRASKMVENLLNFSRSNNDEFSCINLKDAIKDIIALEKKSVEEKQINIIINCDENIEFCTKTESFTHIILNLLTNAIDSLHLGGSIVIDCYIVNNYLCIDFSDSGEGIEKENIEHIFNPFFTTKKAGKGTGLGLYIVYNELQKIKGEISVKSKVGEGTEFKLKFKIKEEQND
jgi:polar amino acid transport system substrate-binding protein